MGTAILVTGVVLLIGILGAYAPRMVRAYVKYRGKRLVTCPETGETVAIDADVVHAAASAAMGAIELRLENCTRWPGKAGCGEECLRQVEADPAGCLVRTIVYRWYSGKSCALCNQEINTARFSLSRAALLAPDRTTLAWSEVDVVRLPQLLESHEPLCSDCDVAEKLRRELPKVVTRRSAYEVTPPDGRKHTV